MTMYYAFNII